MGFVTGVLFPFSVADTVMLYVPGMVVALRPIEPVPVFEVSAADVAVIVTEAGRPAAIVGGVYVAWVESVAAMDWPPRVGLTLQVTPLLPESLVRVAVKVAVELVQPGLCG
jgi:hypothetical protein